MHISPRTLDANAKMSYKVGQSHHSTVDRATRTLMTHKRLLIVDDEPRFAAFVQRVAEPLGYDVEITNHGRDFQVAYQRQAPTSS